MDCGPSEPAPFDKPLEDIPKPGEIIVAVLTGAAPQITGYVPGGVDEDVLTVSWKDSPPLIGGGKGFKEFGEKLAPVVGRPVQIILAPVDQSPRGRVLGNVSVVWPDAPAGTSMFPEAVSTTATTAPTGRITANAPKIKMRLTNRSFTPVKPPTSDSP
jgi:hypothetical protein